MENEISVKKESIRGVSAIPKHIEDKIINIAKAQVKVKKMIRDIEQWAEEVHGVDIANIVDQDGWTWGMCVDQQGEVIDWIGSEVNLRNIINADKEASE